jgi:hypothetical protein
MRSKTAEKIGAKLVYDNILQIPQAYFDIIFLNLLLCILSECEAEETIKRVYGWLKNKGLTYIGFCNPLAYAIKENNFQIKFPAGKRYDEPHSYRKIIKEGNFEIIENHRPLSFYENLFKRNGFDILEVNLSEGDDFVIYKLIRRSNEKTA